MCEMNYCQHFSPMWPSFEQPVMKCLFSSMIQKLHFWQEDCLNLISTFYASYQNLTKSVLKRFSRYFRSFKRGYLGSHPYLGLVRVAKVKYFKLERHSSEVFSCFFFCQIWRFAAVFWWKWTKTEIFPREGMYVMAKKKWPFKASKTRKIASKSLGLRLRQRFELLFEHFCEELCNEYWERKDINCQLWTRQYIVWKAHTTQVFACKGDF